MERKFRFAIMGAANIAYKFCEAVKFTSDAEVVAIASKSMERAQEFAEKNGIAHTYDNYEEMLLKQQIDCVYIAVTQNAHYELTMLCIKYGVPVLCEKAMFLNSADAQAAHALAALRRVFVMEAMWSRFLPAHRKALEWLKQGEIGRLQLLDASFGFCADKNADNRYFSPTLGGGVSYDLTVYVYELARFYCDEPIRDIDVHAAWSDTGVDVTNLISVQFDTAMASLKTSFQADLDNRIVLYGEKGKIVIPDTAGPMEAFLYQNGNEQPAEHYTDRETKNGFIYEVQEAMRCVRGGSIESEIVPHELTLDCARLFDRILLTR